MKSVIAFVGSARKHGVTHRATRQFLDNLQSSGDVRSELVFLSEHNIGRVSMGRRTRRSSWRDSSAAKRW